MLSCWQAAAHGEKKVLVFVQVFVEKHQMLVFLDEVFCGYVWRIRKKFLSYASVNNEGDVICRTHVKKDTISVNGSSFRVYAREKWQEMKSFFCQ